MVFNWFKRLFCVFLGFGVMTGFIRIVTYLRARCPEVSHGLGILERVEEKE